MRQIQLQQIPNQSLSFTRDDNRWQVTIKQAVTSMIIDVVINDVPVITGVRITGDDFIIPYSYMGVLQGNLMLTTQQDFLPDFNQFGLTQKLYYWSPEEMQSIVSTPVSIMDIYSPYFPPPPPPYYGYSLKLDFARQQFLMGAVGVMPTTRAFSDLITFTRTTGGGRINAIGQFEWVGTNVPRLTYDPVTLQPLGLLVEERRTNLLLNSVFAGATLGVIGSGGALPTNFTLESAAGLTTEIMSVGSENGYGYIDIKVSGTQNGSFYAIRNTGSPATGTTGQSYGGAINARYVSGLLPAGLTLNVLEATGSFSGTSATASLTYSYQRIQTTRVVQLASAPMQVRVQLTPYSGLVDCVFRISAPQLEIGSPSSYIPTTTAQVTRAADVATVNTLSPWYNATEGTIVVSLVRNSIIPGARIATLSGSFGNHIRLEGGFGTPSNVQFTVQSGGVTQALVVGGTGSAGSPLKLAASYKVNAFAVSLNGQASVVDSSGVVPAVSALEIGGHSIDSANKLNGTISSLTYSPRVIDVQQASA